MVGSRWQVVGIHETLVVPCTFFTCAAVRPLNLDVIPLSGRIRGVDIQSHRAPVDVFQLPLGSDTLHRQVVFVEDGPQYDLRPFDVVVEGSAHEIVV